ncbi:MAG TPA: TlyA family RNA methyltransferase [Dehalococcoidia bacterium]|nr:TlyA family RNA methyltransferase [Dehalococcoidia bacterium]
MGKRRLDALLLERGLVESREKAQVAVMAGDVLVDDRPAVKPASLVDEDASLRLVERQRYVSRGGEKLEHALDAFAVDVMGAVSADIGASTGGFTDCLLQRGAVRVYAVDVGRGQLDVKLRSDPRVVVMEGVNARYLEALPEAVELATVDVAFISLRQVLPAVRRLLRPGGRIVALFKPQFEAAKREVGRGGVIRDPQLHARLIGRFADWCVKNGFRIRGLTASPLLGPAGNREFFFDLRPIRQTRSGEAAP